MNKGKRYRWWCMDGMRIEGELVAYRADGWEVKEVFLDRAGYWSGGPARRKGMVPAKAPICFVEFCDEENGPN